MPTMWEDRCFEEKNIKTFLIHFINKQDLLDLTMKREVLFLR
jgi:hypothetical protein